MTSRNTLCPHCGHLFNDEHPYFSEDFAAYYSEQSCFALRWCYHCTYVSSYSQPSFLKIIRLPGLRVKSSIPIQSVDTEPLWMTEDEEIGLIAGAHLLRMVWHCLNARIEIENGKSDSKENVVHRALTKLPPREAALMLFITANALKAVPLVRQIQEGCLIKDSIPISRLEQWLSSSSATEAASETLERLRAYAEK